MQKRRYSKQRECILNALRSTKSHPTANAIYDMVRAEIPNISLGTVYRNLSELSMDGTIIKIAAGDGGEHYDGCNLPHYHMFCKRCGSVSDIDIEYHSVLDSSAAHASGAEVDCHSIVFTGTCKECKTKEK